MTSWSSSPITADSATVCSRHGTACERLASGAPGMGRDSTQLRELPIPGAPRSQAPRRRFQALLFDFAEGLFVASGKPVASTLNRSGELLEVHFKCVENLVGVVLGAEADLTLA